MTTFWNRRFFCSRALATATTCSLPLVVSSSAAFVYFSQTTDNGRSSCPSASLPQYLTREHSTTRTSRSHYQQQVASATTISTPHPLACSAAAAAAAASDDHQRSTHRLKQTAADRYYAKHQELPRPSIMHAILPESVDVADDTTTTTTIPEDLQPKHILVVGDVHGCFGELQTLHEKAIRESNDGCPFQWVILVGDLCNKGPRSAEVVRWARTTPRVRSVRGNHDDGALGAAIGDERRRAKSKYQWALQGEKETRDCDNPPTVLSDEDVAWLSELPYTLTIPGSYLNEDDDTLIVHAGLIPGIPIEDQTIETMVTIREVVPTCDKQGVVRSLEYNYKVEKGNPAQARPTIECNVPVPWASLWKGPQRVIFGHDARRGLQRYPYATGLDTGACYGKELTGMILSAQTTVSVSSKEYSPVGVKRKKPQEK